MADTKGNMKQAMRELLGLVGIGPEGDKDRDMEKQPISVDEHIENTVLEQEVSEPVERKFFGGSAPQPEAGPLFGDQFRTEPEYTVPDEPTFTPAPNGTVISAGTSIFGDIRSEGVVEVHGKLKGDLEATGNVHITGKVLGDVKGDTVILAGCAVQGNVTAASSLRIDAGTVVVGDITAVDMVTDGKVKGTVKVEKSASFQKNAVLSGNVTAALVSMCEGAKIQGTVRISEDSDTSALFGDNLDI